MFISDIRRPIEEERIYSSTARFDGTGRPLTENELCRIAPSIFEVDGHPDTSENFAPIATIAVLRALARNGFVPVGAQQTGRGSFAKHLVRLRAIKDLEDPKPINSTVCEILLRNANDGTAAYEILAGLWRIICQNSLVSMARHLDTVKVKHRGDVMSEVIDGTSSVLRIAETAISAAVDWPKKMLNDTLALDMARVSHTMRFESPTPFEPAELLKPRRAVDNSRDLWTTFNVIQENVIKGGLSTFDDRAYTRVMKPINNIDRSVNLNKELWQLAETVFEAA